MAANEGAGSAQVYKRYQLFDVDSFEEKVVKKAKGADIAADSGSSLEPRFKLSSIVSSQGLVVYNDMWYIAGAVPISDSPSSEMQYFLFVCSKGVTLSSLQCHSKCFGIRGVELNKVGYIATLGEDVFPEQPGRKISDSRPSGVLLKIWKADLLIENKYVSLSDYIKGDVANKTLPKTIPLDKNIPFHHIISMAASKDLSHIAIGLQNGNAILIKSGVESIAVSPEKDIRSIMLTPDPGFALPVTNIYLYDYQEKGKSMYFVFCTCEKAFYMYQITPKQNNFALIANDIGAQPGEMDGSDMNISILCPTIGELRKYKGPTKDKEWPMKEHGVINK